MQTAAYLERQYTYQSLKADTKQNREPQLYSQKNGCSEQLESTGLGCEAKHLNRKAGRETKPLTQGEAESKDTDIR
jgi:hypothetical protein